MKKWNIEWNANNVMKEMYNEKREIMRRRKPMKNIMKVFYYYWKYMK